MRLFRANLFRFRRDEGGATAIEYGLIAALLVVAILSSLNNFATANDEMYKTLEDNLVIS